MEILEHPEIERCRRLGYPYIEEAIYECEQCGGKIYQGEEIYNLPRGEKIHQECLEKYFQPYRSIAGEWE